MRLDPDNIYQKLAIENLQQLSTILKNERIEQGLTQRQVAEKGSTSQASISRLENKLYTKRLIWTIAQIAALGCEVHITEKL